MKVTIDIENINEEEFNEIFELSEFPEIFENFKIGDICTATNTSAIGSGIIQGVFFQILVEKISGVALGLLTSFLYDKMKTLNENRKSKKIKIKINNKDLEEKSVVNNGQV